MGKGIKDLENLKIKLVNYIKEGGSLDSEYKRVQLGKKEKNKSLTYSGGLLHANDDFLVQVGKSAKVIDSEEKFNLSITHPFAYDLVTYICEYEDIKNDITQEISSLEKYESEIPDNKSNSSNAPFWNAPPKKTNSAAQEMSLKFGALSKEIDVLIKSAEQKVFDTYDDVTSATINHEVSKLIREKATQAFKI